MENRISGTLTSDDLTALKSLIAELKARLPFLKEFTPEEIREMTKLGGRSLEFVQTGVEASQAQVEHLPRSFDPGEFQRDYALFQALETVRLSLEPVWRMLNNTQIAVGSDALEGALEVYASLKRAPKGSGAEVYVDQMKQRFSYRRSTETEATSEASATETPATAATAATAPPA